MIELVEKEPDGRDYAYLFRMHEVLNEEHDYALGDNFVYAHSEITPIQVAYLTADLICCQYVPPINFEIDLDTHIKFMYKLMDKRIKENVDTGNVYRHVSRTQQLSHIFNYGTIDTGE